MSGDTTIGNALQFTNDNKHAYAYSGSKLNSSGVGDADQQLLLFNTNSEYLKAKFQFTTTQSSGHDYYADIFFNDIDIVQIKEDSTDVEGFPIMIRLIIPPFTVVKVMVGQNSAGYYNQCNMVAKVGMPQRVGNLDE